jgi:hypothetical protein
MEEPAARSERRRQAIVDDVGVLADGGPEELSFQTLGLAG